MKKATKLGIKKRVRRYVSRFEAKSYSKYLANLATGSIDKSMLRIQCDAEKRQGQKIVKRYFSPASLLEACGATPRGQRQARWRNLVSRSAFSYHWPNSSAATGVAYKHCASLL